MKIDFIKIFIERKAADYLYSWLKTEKLHSNADITVKKTLICFKNVLLDKNWHLKACSELSKLKMTYLKDFNEFYTEFLKLMNIAQLFKAQWKENFHDKLYKFLQILMKAAVSNDNKTFKVYCHKTQHFVWELVKAEENTQKHVKELKKKKLNSKIDKKADTSIDTAVITMIKTELTDVKCYTCDQKRYISRNCSDKQQTKIKSESKAVNSNSSDSGNDLL